MRAAPFVKYLLGPALMVVVSAIVLVHSIRPNGVDAGAVAASVVLMAMMALAAVAALGSQRERRGARRGFTWRQCPDCRASLRGVVDAPHDPVLRCVRCLREQADDRTSVHVGP